MRVCAAVAAAIRKAASLLALSAHNPFRGGAAPKDILPWRVEISGKALSQKDRFPHA